MDGFDIVATTQFTDLSDRPQYVVVDRQTLPEMIGEYGAAKANFSRFGSLFEP